MEQLHLHSHPSTTLTPGHRSPPHSHADDQAPSPQSTPPLLPPSQHTFTVHDDGPHVAGQRWAPPASAPRCLLLNLALRGMLLLVLVLVLPLSLPRTSASGSHSSRIVQVRNLPRRGEGGRPLLDLRISGAL